MAKVNVVEDKLKHPPPNSFLLSSPPSRPPRTFRDLESTDAQPDKYNNPQTEGLYALVRVIILG